MRAALISFALCLCMVGGPALRAAERADSTARDWSRHEVAWKDIAAPAALLGAGTFGLCSPWFQRTVNVPVNDYVTGIRRSNNQVLDNTLQYAPLAGVVVLGLFAESDEDWVDRVLLLGTGMVAEASMVNSIKYAAHELRPDGSAYNSFPSGHTATAFLGAELVRLEYGWGYGAAAYAVAAGVGALRVYHSRHWVCDVLAGAGIGILSARIAWWLLPAERRCLDRLGIFPTVQAAPTGEAVPSLALSYRF